MLELSSFAKPGSSLLCSYEHWEGIWLRKPVCKWGVFSKPCQLEDNASWYSTASEILRHLQLPLFGISSCTEHQPGSWAFQLFQAPHWSTTPPIWGKKTVCHIYLHQLPFLPCCIEALYITAWSIWLCAHLLSTWFLPLHIYPIFSDTWILSYQLVLVT